MSYYRMLDLTNERRREAWKLFSEYDFSPLVVKDTDNWEVFGDIWFLTVYLEREGEDEPSQRVQLRVAFVPESPRVLSLMLYGDDQ